jgi:DUF1680 family protein
MSVRTTIALNGKTNVPNDKHNHHPLLSPFRVTNELPFGSVRFTDGFWRRHLDLCCEVTLPSMRKSLHNPDNGAYLPNFRIAAGLEQGPHRGENWSDGDCYKYLEALVLVDCLKGESRFKDEIEELIVEISGAQEADGYINTQITLNPEKARWSDTLNHEDYNLGHLFTAAVAHKACTDSDSLLAVALKAADYLYSVFQPCPAELAHFGWNPSNIMGLVELYRTTGNSKYLELGEIFVSMRGSAPGGGDQHQDRIPLRKESEAVGHAVAGIYLYSGAADVVAETGEPDLLEALKRVWGSAAKRRTYITGGVGSLHKGSSFHFRFAPETQDVVSEAFSIDYHLPNHTAYNETCANIGNAMWNWRMLLILGDSSHADIVERVIYNSMLSGLNIGGNRFFYTNPLAWHGREHQLLNQDARERWELRNCYCCPPQVARTIPRLSSWIYSHFDDILWVHQYTGCELDALLPMGPVRLRQTTNLPWDGKVTIQVASAPLDVFELRMRIPDWTAGPVFRVNGSQLPDFSARDGYMVCRRNWKPGDRVEIEFPMPVRYVRAHPRVEECRGQVAVMRGPLVYCLESHDLPDGVCLGGIRLFNGMSLDPRHDDSLLGGVTVLEGLALTVDEEPWRDTLYRIVQDKKASPVHVRLIPYFAWNNRGEPEMAVWFPWMEDCSR